MDGSCESVRSAMESQPIQTTQDVLGWTLRNLVEGKCPGVGVNFVLKQLAQCTTRSLADDGLYKVQNIGCEPSDLDETEKKTSCKSALFQ